MPDGELRGVECVGPRRPATGLPDAPAFALPDGDEDAAFVDLERDVTVADIRRAVGAGLRSVEHVKRYTTIGTGSDQGKTANVNAIRVAAELLGVHPGELGTTTFRPPYTPVPFALLAGRDRGDALRPGPHDADPPVARRARRGVRGRRPVEAAALLPARRRVRWTTPCCASARPRARRVGDDGRVARSARSTSRAPTRSSS